MSESVSTVGGSAAGSFIYIYREIVFGFPENKATTATTKNKQTNKRKTFLLMRIQDKRPS